MGTHGVEFSTENITFLHPCHGLQQANGAEFWILAYLCSVLRTWGGVAVLFLHLKDNILLSILVYNRVLFALVLCHKDNKRLSIDRQTRS